MIVDDYGTFQGARKAVDEYMLGLNDPPLLNRIDIGVVSGVKPPPRRLPWWSSLITARSDKAVATTTSLDRGTHNREGDVHPDRS